MRAKATGGEAWRGRTLARVRAAHRRKETVPTGGAYLSAAERRGGASWAGERELGRRDWAARGEKGKGKRAGLAEAFWAERSFFFLSFARDSNKFNLNSNLKNSNSN